MGGFFKAAPLGCGFFTITLTNVTSYPGSVDNFDFPSTVAATGIFFNLFDYDICGGSVVGPNADGGDEIVSAYWGYNNGYKSLEAFEQPSVLTSWDTVVSTLSGSLTKTYGATFTGSTDFGSVDGPPHGVLPSSEGYPANKTDYLYGYASIIIDLNNDVDDWETFFSQIDAGDVVVSFGSPTAPAPVPEPTTMLLFGTGLVGFAAMGRKKFKK